MKKLYRKFLSETSGINHCYVSYLSNNKCCHCSFPNSFVDGLIIRAYDSWVRFSRELLMQSAAENPTTLGGVKLAKAVGINKRSDIVPNYLSKLPKRLQGKPIWWEPRWGIANQFLDVANSIGVPNYYQLSAGIGLANSPSEDLRNIRNFVAHRKEDTANKLIPLYTKYKLNTNLNIYFLLSNIATGGFFQFSVWLKNFQVMAEICMQ